MFLLTKTLTVPEVDVYYNAEKRQLEYAFLDYDAYTTVADGITRVRRRCTVRVPMSVPYGYKVAVSAAILEYSGVIASEGGQGYTSLRYRFGDQSSTGITRNFTEPGALPQDNSRIIYVRCPPLQRVWAGCSARISL